MNRIHIVGVGPRTGTTLLAECMATSFEIDAVEAHEASLTAHRRDVETYLTKRPFDLANVEPRLRFDRRFHVICMLRDPRDAIVSRHGSDRQRYWTPLSLWKWQITHVRRLQRHPRFLLLRYEELVADPDRVQLEIASRLPFLEKKSAFSAFHRVADPSSKSIAALGGIRPIGQERIGNWRNHLPRVAGQLQLYGPITAELIEFGYEKDDSWLRLLDGVVPDLSPSHWQEGPGVERSIRRERRRAGLDAARLFAARAFGSRLL
jgi:hypothetical protein